MAIDNGLKTWGDYRKAKKTSTESDFLMEDLNAMLGEGEDAFFTIQSFKQNQDLIKSWKPPKTVDILMQHDLGNPRKGEAEVRLVVADYAFANTTKKGQENDNTIFLLMSLHWKGNHFERHVDYMEGHAGGDSNGANDRARELFWDYNADYYVPDERSGGETLYNLITMEWEHPERGMFWNKQGLTISNNKDIQVLPDYKLADLRARTVDPSAYPCIIPMQGQYNINSVMWADLKKQLEMNNIKFLIDAKQYQEHLEDTGEYYNMTSEQFAEAMLPYAQVEMLIQEAVNLSAEYKEGKVKLKEPRNSTKDRAVCLAYANYIATKIENQWNKMAVSTDDNINDINLVF